MLSSRTTIDDLLQLSTISEREPESHARPDRIGRYSSLLAARAGLSPARCELIGLAAPLHDIGKVGVPPEVLSKVGWYSSAERAAMERHTETGYSILTRSSSEIGELAATIALTHHERCDGSGYPFGLRREEIPLEGRIVGIADAFDALTTHRPYRDAMSLKDAACFMTTACADEFDRTLLHLFLSRPIDLYRIRATSYATTCSVDVVAVA